MGVWELEICISHSLRLFYYEMPTFLGGGLEGAADS